MSAHNNKVQAHYFMILCLLYGNHSRLVCSTVHQKTLALFMNILMMRHRINMVSKDFIKPFA